MPYDLTYIWKLKNKKKRKIQDHVYRKQIGGCWRQVAEGGGNG